MKVKKNSLFIIILCLSMPQAAMADFSSHYGPPSSVIWAIMILIALVGIGVNILLSKGIKLGLEYWRKERKKHLWYQLILGGTAPIVYLFIQDIFFSEPNQAWIVYLNMLLSMILGTVLGYFITPNQPK